MPLRPPVPFPVARKWHPASTLYTVPPALQGVPMRRGSPYPLTESAEQVRGFSNRQASTADGRATPWLQVARGRATAIVGPPGLLHLARDRCPVPIRPRRYGPIPMGPTLLCVSAARADTASHTRGRVCSRSLFRPQGGKARNRVGYHTQLSRSWPAGQDHAGFLGLLEAQEQTEQPSLFGRGHSRRTNTILEP